VCRVACGLRALRARWAGGGVVVVSVKPCCQESELRASREVGSLSLMRTILVDLGTSASPASYVNTHMFDDFLVMFLFIFICYVGWLFPGSCSTFLDQSCDASSIPNFNLG
jgi:hypothetical protein